MDADDEGEMGAYMRDLLKGNDWSRFQAFVARRG
jgi:hypothetical protein